MFFLSGVLKLSLFFLHNCLGPFLLPLHPCFLHFPSHSRRAFPLSHYIVCALVCSFAVPHHYQPTPILSDRIEHTSNHPYFLSSFRILSTAFLISLCVLEQNVPGSGQGETESKIMEAMTESHLERKKFTL